MKMNLDEVKLQKEELYKLVKGFFKDDEKTTLWFSTPNLNFGDTTPDMLIFMGRAHKVKEFVVTSLSENQPAS
jgi:hypothetical protein